LFSPAINGRIFWFFVTDFTDYTVIFFTSIKYLASSIEIFAKNFTFISLFSGYFSLHRVDYFLKEQWWKGSAEAHLKLSHAKNNQILLRKNDFL